MKMKEFGPPGGGARPWRPPLDPPMYGILFVDTVDTKIKACNALNAIFVETVNTTVKTHPYIPAHNFLNIQWIFNSQKVLKS